MIDLQNVDLRLLAIFEAVYEAGSVTGAAERLALSQLSVDEALARLREECGDDLFFSVDHGLSPTPAAVAMYSAIRKTLVEWRRRAEKILEKSHARDAHASPCQREQR